MEKHEKAVFAIAERIKQFYSNKESFRIYHGSTNSTRPSQFKRDKTVDTSHLLDILKVDQNSQTVLVEPNVPMDRLVETTLKYGLIPPVVMEFPGITVGGGFAGTSGESSSFKYGFFDRTVNWIEIILADGQIVDASLSERADLFQGASGSFGTFGVVTLLELQLVKAKSFVELTYYPVSSVTEAAEITKVFTKDPSIDFIDGILFAVDRGVIMTGRLTETHGDLQRFSRAQDPWFHVHAESCTKSEKETIPIVEYLFRYDRGAFWTGVYAFKYFLIPFNRLTRWILDSFMHTRVMYHALHESGHGKRYIIQDVAMPYSTVEEFFEYIDKTLGFYPIWLVPIRPNEEPSMNPHRLNSKTQEMMLSFGVWGPGPSDQDRFINLNRKLEQKIRELLGMKWLYAHTYYTEDEFWSMYNHKWYEDLRIKYNATSLPTIYDKVKVDTRRGDNSWFFWLVNIFWSIWPLSGLWGVYRTLSSREYLLSH